jgi:hypothetical protein
MAKFHGPIGFAVSEETKPGVWTNKITERTYTGDVKPTVRIMQTSDQINDDLNVTDQISIMADAFANENFHAMRYVEYMGALWKVSSVRVERPRLILTLGGVYNGQRPSRHS